jgi:hypothetical protein
MARKGKQNLADLPNFENQLNAIDECDIMVHYAQNQGFAIPDHTLRMLSDIHAIKRDLEQAVAEGKANQLDPRSLNMAVIGDIHKELAGVIAPASPATVLMLERNRKNGVAGLFGQVPLVRRLNFITIICLFTFLGLFFADQVDSESINGDILSYSDPIKFLLNELVIVAIAALGSAFYALFEAHKYISKNAYDSKYDSIYWIRFVLGIVSGVILAQFIFIESADNFDQVNGFMSNKPLLAFLGGFSARVVHKILNSLVDSIETFISGSARDMIKAREEVARIQLEDKIAKMKIENAQNDAMERMKTTMKLMEMQQLVNNGAGPQDIQLQINSLMNNTMKPVSGVNVNFDTGQTAAPENGNVSSNITTPAVNFDDNDYAPIVDDYSDNPVLPDMYPEVEIGDDIDQIDIPDFPKDMDNPDFPMPGDMDDDFDPTAPIDTDKV